MARDPYNVYDPPRSGPPVQNMNGFAQPSPGRRQAAGSNRAGYGQLLPTRPSGEEQMATAIVNALGRKYA